MYMRTGGVRQSSIYSKYVQLTTRFIFILYLCFPGRVSSSGGLQKAIMAIPAILDLLYNCRTTVISAPIRT